MKTLIVVAHPAIADSVVNRRWLAEAEKYPDRFTIHQLYSAYPDWQIDVAKEQALLEAHDRIVLQFPLYWFSSPPLLKKWLDDVFTYGWAYGAQSGYKLKGKRISLAVTAGIKEEDYAAHGRYQNSLAEILRPFEITLKYVQAEWGSFFAFYGIETMSDTAPDENTADYDAGRYIDFMSASG